MPFWLFADWTDYLLEANRQLEDTNYYKWIMGPLQLETQKIIRAIIDKLYADKYINFKQMTWRDPRPCMFYLLPEIHKTAES